MPLQLEYKESLVTHAPHIYMYKTSEVVVCKTVPHCPLVLTPNKKTAM